jgi:putative ABC transport system permease protein
VLRYTLSSVWAAKGRLLLTAVAIVLGVAAISGTLVVTDSAAAAARAASTQAHPRVDVVVRAAPHGEGEVLSDITGELFAPPMPAAAVDRVARLDGVAAAIGVVSGDAQLIGRDGHVVGGGRAPLGRSVDPSFAGDLRAGRVPGGPGEVVVDRTTAQQQRFGVGDRVRVLVSGGEPRTLTVVGILDAEEIPAAVVLVGFDPATARRLLAPGPGQVSHLEVLGAAAGGEQPLPERVAAVLGPGYQAFTSSQLAAERARNASPSEGGNGQVFFIASMVALFVGMFLIRNTFTIVLASRTGELALLRCVGASRAQLRRSVLLQAAVVGALASLAGLLAGVALARGLGALLASADEAVVDVAGPTRVVPRTTVVALAVGVATAVVSAWSPARRAVRVPPVAALRGDALALDRREGRARALAGAPLAAAGIGLVLAGALGDPVQSAYLVAGVVATAVGVLVLGPVLARSLARLLGVPVGRLAGLVGGLARGNAVRSPRRTSATVLPLVIGVTLVTFLAVLAASTKASATGGLDRTLRADHRLAAVGVGMHRPRISPRVAERLAGLPELAAVAAFQDAAATVAGQESGVTAADPGQLGKVLSLEMTGGALSDLSDGGIAVSRQAADDLHLAVGSPVAVRTPRGRLDLIVRAVYDLSRVDAFARQQLPLGDFLVTTADYRRLGGQDGLTMVLADRRDGVGPAAARAAIERAIPDYPNVEIAGRAELRRRAAAAIDPALRLFYSLLGVAVVIALFGILNTLALSVLERTRELGLLRAVGMERRQVRDMIRWETVIIAAIGATIGLGLGVLIAWAVGRDLELPATLPVGQLALVAVAAIASGVLAAALPARRAARVDVLRAIVTE